MGPTLKVLGLIGFAAAGVAAIKRLLTTEETRATPIRPPLNVSHELQRALARFEDRFGT